MEKFLNKSRSRYFFGGKKKTAKDPGSEPIAIPPDEDLDTPFDGRNRVHHPGVPVGGVGGSPVHHVRPPRPNFFPEYAPPAKHILDRLPMTASTTSLDREQHSQSGFDVQGSQTTFSPLVTPSSTPPRKAYNHCLSTTPSQPREISPFKPKIAGDARAQHSRTQVLAHSRSQSALATVQPSSSPGGLRPHCVPESFIDMSEVSPGVTQNARAERNISDTLNNTPTSSASSNTFSQYSSSVPVLTKLSSFHIQSDLTALRESQTVPIDVGSVQSTFPRSNASYNLAKVAQNPSAPIFKKRLTKTDFQSPPYAGQSGLELGRPRRDPLPTVAPAVSANTNATTSSAGTNSEKEIGFDGLVFPLPPSGEEGLAMSSSQISLILTAHGRNPRDTPATSKKSQAGNEERVAIALRNIVSRGNTASGGANSRIKNQDERITTMSNTKTHNIQDPKDVSHAAKLRTEVQKDGQGRIRNESIRAIGIDPAIDKEHAYTSPAEKFHASESSFPMPQASKIPEQVQPLSFDPETKRLHTVRSFSTNSSEHKHGHMTRSNVDLSCKVQNENEPAERDRNVTVTSIVGPRAPIQSESEPPVPSRFVLPTPPQSSSALSFVATEQKGPDNIPQQILDDMANGRFEELARYILDVTRRYSTEREAYEGRIVHLEDAVAKMMGEIRGLRWLVLDNPKARQVVAEKPPQTVAQINHEAKENKKRLRRSLTMPTLAKIQITHPKHPRSKRDAIGLGLGFSPESLMSSPSVTISPQTKRSSGPLPEAGERTPSMDEIIDKLMGVRQWATAEVRVSVVDDCETDGGGESKRIVFREP